jgi:hypothetical protein
VADASQPWDEYEVRLSGALHLWCYSSQLM